MYAEAFIRISDRFCVFFAIIRSAYTRGAAKTTFYFLQSLTKRILLLPIDSIDIHHFGCEQE
jgi:hypothetical protein